MATKGVYIVNTPKAGSPSRSVLVLLCLSLLLTSCGKKCQQVNNAYEFLSDTPWRLVETTDRSSGFRKLSIYSFPVLTLGLNFRGDIKSVVNNEQFDNAICNIIYKPAEGNLVAMQFSEGAAGGDPLGGDEEQAPTTPQCPFAGTRTFEYKLGRQLELTDVKTGKYYRFAPFLGIVQPDSQCTF